MELGLEQAQRLVQNQFPQWAELPLTPFQSFGTDHILYRLGSDKVVRFPIKTEIAQNIPLQQNWLAKFAKLPLDTPQILGIGRADDNFPYAWSVAKWIDGQDAASTPITDWSEAAVSLGRFVRELRMIDTTGGITSGQHNAWRGCPLAMLDDRTRGAIGLVSDLFDRATLTAIWEQALSAPVWESGPTWIHGDIHAANMVVRDGQIAGVIDFGLMALGDPACDLALAWSFLPARYRDLFLHAAEASEAMQLRGKGWGLYAGVIAFSYYRDNNPVLAAISSQTIEAVLADQ